MRSGRLPRLGCLGVGTAPMPPPTSIRMRVVRSLLMLALLASACGGADVDEPQPEPEPAISIAPEPVPEPGGTTEPDLDRTAPPLPEPEPESAVEPEPISEPSDASEPVSGEREEPDPSSSAGRIDDDPGASTDACATISDPLRGVALELPDPVAAAPEAFEAAGDKTPVELSADPVLQWTEIDPGLGDAFRLQPTFAGGVLATLRMPEDQGSGLFRVTFNGVDWQWLSLPEGIAPSAVDVSGDLWLVVGRGQGGDTSDSAAMERVMERVLVSSDRGRTWTEVPVDSAPPVPHTVDQYLGVSSALVRGDCILLAVEVFRSLNWAELLADRGLISREQAGPVVVVKWGSDSVFFALYRDPDTIVATAQPDDFVEYSFDELDLTADQRDVWTAIVASMRDPFGQRVRIFSGDPAGLVATAEYKGYVVRGTSTAGGFVLHQRRWVDPSEHLQNMLLASSDGRAWSEVRLGPEVDYRLVDAYAADACVTLWGTDWDESFSTVQDLCPGQAAETVAILPGVTTATYGRSSLAAGPAGLVVTVTPGGFRTVELPDGDQVPIGGKPDTWVGWSADGTEWEWQAAADIFGPGGGNAPIDLAVGGDFVLAHVNARDEPSRWFIAKVR